MGERTVMVLTSKVAQKSYGTEKRFLCPPPTTLLKGASWWTNTTSAKPNMTEPKKSLHFFHSQNNTLTSPKLTIHISGENINQSGVVEWQSSNGAIIDTSNLTSNLSPAISQHHSSVTGRCVSKQLFINDADEKRKRVEVLAKIQLGNGIQLGTFPSKGIKVISKPSKKRQSVKNMELCIHHGTTISLFNRIRSQTVSTKYLGVSKGSIPIPNDKSGNHSNNTTNGTCFVARTGSWDPFVIWVVDTSRSPDITNIPKPSQHHPSNPHFPPPPAIALQASSTSQQPIAIHYNQPVVLQCVSTGLVSPVMIIRKVDKASMVLGGNRMDDLSGKTGGECGDETLGDPVSQLHKIAFQIVQDPSFSHHNKARFTNNPLRLSPYPSVNDSNTNWRIPQSCHPVTYLACLNDVVGMHKTTATRNLISQCLPRSSNSRTIENNQVMDSNHDSTNTQNKPTNRRMSTINETKNMTRRASVADRRVGSTVDSSGLEGACWTEDVSDAAVWTIVGTDCATYTFWTPADVPESGCFNMPFDANNNPCSAITPFPTISQTVSSSDLKNHKKSPTSPVLTILGENLTRDLSVWFGDIKSTKSEYKSRDTIVCTIPDPHDLLTSPTLHSDNDGGKRRIPLLLVRGDGVVYRTDQHYTF
ncbi:beta-trefoil DNA-binding domain-containing protein [Pilobolus umbonatus]|nr:beta-trefoil DNA-binding domain-containing protein [Pilobolus umbonatus]